MDPSLASMGSSFEETIILRQLQMTLPQIVRDHEEFWNGKILGEHSFRPLTPLTSSLVSVNCQHFTFTFGLLIVFSTNALINS